MTGLEALAAVASVASAVGTVVSAVGAIKQGNAAQAASQYNATVSRQNAEAVRADAAANAERQERAARIRRGQNIAAAAASGLALEGSVLDIMEDNAIEEELDRLTILQRGEVDAAGLLAGAEMQEIRGRAAQREGRLSAGATLLSGAASTAQYASEQGLFSTRSQPLSQGSTLVRPMDPTLGRGISRAQLRPR